MQPFIETLTDLVAAHPVPTLIAVVAVVVLLALVRWYRRMFGGGHRVKLNGSTYHLTLRDVHAIYAGMDEGQQLLHQQRVRNGADPWREHVFVQATIRYLQRTGRWRD